MIEGRFRDILVQGEMIEGRFRDVWVCLGLLGDIWGQGGDTQGPFGERFGAAQGGFGAQELTEVAAVEHVKDAARRADDDVRRFELQLLHLGTNIGAADAGVAGGPHVIAQRHHHLLDLDGP